MIFIIAIPLFIGIVISIIIRGGKSSPSLTIEQCNEIGDLLVKGVKEGIEKENKND